MDYKKNWVTKSNMLIMGKYDLTVAETRLILMLISLIQPDDENFREYTIPVSDYLKVIKRSDGRAYELLNVVTDSLMKRVLEKRRTDGGFEKVNWLSYSKYDRTAGHLICSFDPHLKEDLLFLKREFTTYQLEYALRLSSKYSFRLYEILKRFSKIGSWKITIDELKDQLNIPEKYKWLNIKQRVLQPAKKELSSTDIRFDYTTFKRGRRVHSIKFEITDTHQLALELEPAAPPSTPDTANEKNPAENLLDLIPAAEKKDVKKLIQQAQKKYPAEYIQGKILLANAQKNLENYPGWLSKALADDYKKSEKSQKKKSGKPKKQPPEKSVSASASDDKKTAIEIAKQRKIRKKFAALSEKEREKWIARARSETEECGAENFLPRGLILIHASQLWAENTSAI